MSPGMHLLCQVNISMDSCPVQFDFQQASAESVLASFFKDPECRITFFVDSLPFTDYLF